ncbi:regulator of G-protein signaling 22-like [Salvelinus fontinalis]|uniref:regulator of G-protein signaling 22-like n=1 Tax=Salvelinus fontinalis TaxID=8038 RepID=UPI002486AAC5|nr:regulator of G-protein signaling 22-like [Salvelinus fontinalis]
MLGKITTDPPYLTIDNFEDCLASDDLLVHFFNDFLSLPSFPECVQYNQETGVFEVVSGSAEALSRRIRSALQHFQSQRLTDPTELAARPVVDNHYTVLCLDRVQGVKWILQERLSLFIQSDCYFEYRLAKLFSQWGPRGCNQKRDGASVPHPVTTEPVCPSPGPDDRETLMKVLYVSLGQASVTDMLTMAKDEDKQLPVCTRSVRSPVCSLGREGQRGPSSACFSCIPDSESYALSSSLLVSFPLSSSLLDWDRRRGDHSPEQEMKVYLTETETEAKTEIEAGTTDEGNGDPKPQSPSCSTTDEETGGPHTESPCEGGPGSQVHVVFQGSQVHVVFQGSQVHVVFQGSQVHVLVVFQGSQVHVVFQGSQVHVVFQGSQVHVVFQGSQVHVVFQGSQVHVVFQGSQVHVLVVFQGSQVHVVFQGSQVHVVFQGSQVHVVFQGSQVHVVFQGSQVHVVFQGTQVHVLVVFQGSQVHVLVVFQGSQVHVVFQGSQVHVVVVFQGSQVHVVFQGSQVHVVFQGGPRFRMRQRAIDPLRLSLWRNEQLRPPSGVNPNPRYITIRPHTSIPRPTIHPDTSLPRDRTPTPAHTSIPRLTIRPDTSLPRDRTPTPAHTSIPRLTIRPDTSLPRDRTHTPAHTSIPRLTIRPDTSLPRDRTPTPAHTSIPRLTIRPDTSLPRDRIPTPAHTKTGYASSSPVVGTRRRERMLQGLCVDSQAGFYFTRYCERSGNPLWENAVHFWCDLQQYHQLFYQDGLDPYRVQRQAHLLYSTYVCSAARSSIGAEEESRERVYTCLTPPFEELFDWVEEHTLTLLLEPWTLLTTRDTDAFQKVAVREETRQVESEQYRELKTLYEEAVHGLEQQAVAQACRPPPPPLEVPRSPALWSAVPERYRGYRLGSLLGHRMELQHFTSFLQDNTASIHLACWQDIENYRRTPHKDKAQREDKSRLIKDKYLNRKYFFGPDSPATRQQQDEVMRLAGGWGRLLHDRLCAPVLVNIQSIIRNHIETRWLPVFLTTSAFNERQQQRVRPRGEDEVVDQVYQRHRNKREVWKQVKGTWMTSAGEILALRRALLNPVTCHQFRRFVSLKGDFLENDIVFWLEVQRYKDLCHSHCLEAVVQDKVSTIISCFIQSSVPPALQIDIPPEQASHILERRREMGPYVFREAQMCVFSELLKLWPEFLSFSSGVQEEEVLSMLQNSVNKQSAKLQRRRRREEEVERRAQEEVERRAQEEVERFPEEEEKHRGQQESRELLYPSQQLSWSYSKYLVALEREEVLLRRQAQLELTSSTGTDSSSAHSLKSEGSRHS